MGAWDQVRVRKTLRLVISGAMPRDGLIASAARLGLQGLPAAHTGGFAILIDHPAAVPCAAAIVVSPFTAEFLVNGEALRVAEVNVTGRADI